MEALGIEYTYIEYTEYVTNGIKTDVHQLLYLEISKEKMGIHGHCSEKKARDLPWVSVSLDIWRVMQVDHLNDSYPILFRKEKTYETGKHKKYNEWFLEGLICTTGNIWQHGKEWTSVVSLTFNQSMSMIKTLSAMEVDNILLSKKRECKNLISNLRILLQNVNSYWSWSVTPLYIMLSHYIASLHLEKSVLENVQVYDFW